MAHRFAWLLGALFLGATDASADPRAGIVELVIPDLRYEFADGFTDHDVTLSLPLIYAPWELGLGERYEIIPGGVPGSTMLIARPQFLLVPEVLFEPQYELSEGDARAAAGLRAFAIHGKSGVHAFVEGMGVAGQDGSGGGFGVGLGYGSVVSIGYRRIWTGTAQRNALLFDVRLFVLPRSQPQSILDKLGRYRGPYPAGTSPPAAADAT